LLGRVKKTRPNNEQPRKKAGCCVVLHHSSLRSTFYVRLTPHDSHALPAAFLRGCTSSVAVRHPLQRGTERGTIDKNGRVRKTRPNFNKKKDGSILS